MLNIVVASIETKIRLESYVRKQLSTFSSQKSMLKKIDIKFKVTKIDIKFKVTNKFASAIIC